MEKHKKKNNNSKGGGGSFVSAKQRNREIAKKRLHREYKKDQKKELVAGVGNSVLDASTSRTGYKVAQVQEGAVTEPDEEPSSSTTTTNKRQRRARTRDHEDETGAQAESGTDGVKGRNHKSETKSTSTSAPPKLNIKSFDELREEKRRAREEAMKKREERDRKRKRMLKRTKRGQPIMKHEINNVLSKLMRE